MSDSKNETLHLANIALARMPLRDFFNLVGNRLFPGTWENHFVDALNGTGEGKHSSEMVDYQLQGALGVGLISVEVDLCKLPESDRCWAFGDNDEILYYRLSKESWNASVSKVDWVSSTVSTNPEAFYPLDLALAGVLGDNRCDLNGYVIDPAGSIAGIFKEMMAQVDHYKLAVAYTHHWAEIVAVMWRYIALNKNFAVKHGSIEELVSQVRAYLDEGNSKGKALPSDSQLREAARFVQEQLNSRSAQAAVIPSFSQLKKDSKSKCAAPILWTAGC